MRLAVKGEDLPLWVVADRQTAGRGRAGRTWTSPIGNLYASVAFLCAAPIEKGGQLSLVAGISAIDAIKATVDLAPDALLRLKWPNDIFVGLAKLGGILVESTTARGSPGFLTVLGFGLNILTAPVDLDRSATALARLSPAPPPQPADLVAALDRSLRRWLGVWAEGDGFAQIREAWMARAGVIGEPITVNTIDGPVSGVYRGLSESGALLAEVDGALREISHGDVALQAPSARDGSA